MKEAAESRFVPLCIFNNTKDDADARTRDRFGEPSWNNPVVRFIDGDGNDLLPRIANDYSLLRLAGSMRLILEQRDEEAPPYLDLLAREEAARKEGVETAVFGMD